MSKVKEIFDVLGARLLPPDASKSEQEERAKALEEARLEAIGNQEEE